MNNSIAIRSLTDLEIYRDLWEQYTYYSNVSIFQTWGWSYFWLKYFCNNKEIAIFINDHDQMIFPMYLKSWEDMRIMEFIGTRGSDYLDIIDISKYKKGLDNLVRTFITSDCDILNLEDYPNYIDWSWIEEYSLFYKEIDWCKSCAINLNKDYVSILTPKILRNYRAKKNKLIKDFNSIVIRDGTILELNIHFDLHQGKFSNTWSRGTYYDLTVREFMLDFCRYARDLGFLHYKILEVDKNIVATILGFEFKNCIYVYTVAYDNAYANYGVGRMLYIEDILECEKKGIVKYDLMRGNEIYKKNLGCEESTNYKIVISKKSQYIDKYMKFYKTFSQGYGFQPSDF